jgi:site-specific DNA recombinase
MQRVGHMTKPPNGIHLPLGAARHSGTCGRSDAALIHGLQRVVRWLMLRNEIQMLPTEGCQIIPCGVCNASDGVGVIYGSGEMIGRAELRRFPYPVGPACNLKEVVVGALHFLLEHPFQGKVVYSLNHIQNYRAYCHQAGYESHPIDPRFHFGNLLARSCLSFSRGNGRGGGLLRANGAFLWRHAGGRFLSALTPADLAALRALLSEELQHFRWELLFRHYSILNRVLAVSKISLYLTPGLRYNRIMKAIGYVRVSTERQADFGVSLEAQSEKVRAMAVVQGSELAEVIIDAGESAKSLNRPGMARLLSLVDAGEVDTVIIAKVDRLTRSVKDLAELLERFNRRGVSLVSVAESLDTGTAAGRLVLNIITDVSQWEPEAIGGRTRDAMHHKRANGERVGTLPFGYRTAADGLHLESHSAEQVILSRIRELKAAGRTTRQIADELNRQGFTTRRGTAWRFQYVAEALRAA